MKRRWNIASPNPAAVIGITMAQKVSNLVATVMLNRGVTDKTAARFLSPSLAFLPSPSRMSGMAEASARLAEAIISGEKTVVYHDMDCDGVAAGSLLVRYGLMCGCEFSTYVPHRIKEGYGFHSSSIDRIKERFAPSLVVTVDVGITAHDTAAHCRELGIDLIITDHHTPDQTVPEAIAVVNPHLPCCPYPFKALAGVGVAYALAVATTEVLIERGYFAPGGEPDLHELLPLVALGTIADVVELQGENRILAAEGLKRFYSIPGLRALARVADLGLSLHPTSVQVAFKFAPRVNAAGRLDSASLAAELLMTDDEDRADELARILDQLNTERQDEEARGVEEAVAMVEADPSLLRKTLVLYSENLHPGVAGICAQRLVERYYRPTLMIAGMGDGIAKGSGRSIPAFQMYDGLSEVSDLLKGFGGHPMAAGLTIEVDKIGMFRDAFDATDQVRSLSEEDLVPVVEIDAVASAEDLTMRTIADLKRLEPHGAGNRAPVFCVLGAEVSARKVMGKEKNHLKLTLRVGETNVDAIGFGMADKELGTNVDVAFCLDVNEWRGKRTVQLMLRDIRDAEAVAVPHNQTRTCKGCRASLTRSGAAPDCDLGFPVDAMRGAPLKPCPKPMTYLALRDAQEG